MLYLIYWYNLRKDIETVDSISREDSDILYNTLQICLMAPYREIMWLLITVCAHRKIIKEYHLLSYQPT